MTLQCAMCAGGRTPALPVNIFRIELDISSSRGSDKVLLYTPGDEISGRLLMSNYDFFRCFGIYVALEGTAEVGYESGSRMRIRNESILPITWTRVYFIGSSVAEQSTTNGYKPPLPNILVRNSDYEYKFKIPIKKLLFPGSFSGTHGDITYRVVARIETQSVDSTKITRKLIKIQSYFNLRTVPITLKPATVEGQQYKSIFSKKTGLKFTLNLPRTGFLPGEQIPFNLTVVNPYHKNITRVFVGLSKKVCYVSHVSSKSCKNYVEFLESTDPALIFALEVAQWTDTLTVPKDTYPSVSGMIIQHMYSFRVEISLDENDNPTLQGDVPVIIGTVREIQSKASIMYEGPISRSLSAISITSATSSLLSLPPPYSQLSSRAPSLSSIETLPPFYEDVAATPLHQRRRKSLSRISIRSEKSVQL